ncbi:hypothetical protein ACTA71_006289 [Dictyostelium dimigraforme]
MDFLSELCKIYQDPNNIAKFKLLTPHPMIETKDCEGGKKKGYLQITNNRLIESEPMNGENEAKQQVAKRSLKHLKKLEFEIQNELSFKQKLNTYSTQLLLIMIFGFLILIGLDSKWIPSYSILLINYFILSSPFILFHNRQIGKCIGNRVICKWNTLPENIFEKRVYYLNQGDLFLFGPYVEEPKESYDQVFLAQLKTDIVLYADNKNDKYPTYILPELINVFIGNSDNGYYINLKTYEKDGRLKTYKKKGVDGSLFEKNIGWDKISVISMNGKHLLNERYSIRLSLSYWNWYISVLSIYKGYIFNLLDGLFTNNYMVVDENIGFDNFQNIDQYFAKKKFISSNNS